MLKATILSVPYLLFNTDIVLISEGLASLARFLYFLHYTITLKQSRILSTFSRMDLRWGGGGGGGLGGAPPPVAELMPL